MIEPRLPGWAKPDLSAMAHPLKANMLTSLATAEGVRYLPASPPETLRVTVWAGLREALRVGLSPYSLLLFQQIRPGLHLLFAICYLSFASTGGFA